MTLKFMRQNGLSPPYDEPLQISTLVFQVVSQIIVWGIMIPSLDPRTGLFYFSVIVIGIACGIHWTSWFLVSLTNPVVPETVSDKDSELPRILCRKSLTQSKIYNIDEKEGVYCGICNVNHLPSWSKHCRVCNKCILHFDHHCKWLNHCIGRKNYMWFISYILSTFGSCGIVFLLSLSLIIHRHTPTETPNHSLYGYVFGVSICDYPFIWTVCVAIQLVICAGFLYFMTAMIWMHFSLMIHGHTMWESGLLDDIDYILAEVQRDPPVKETWRDDVKKCLRDGWI